MLAKLISSSSAHFFTAPAEVARRLSAMSIFKSHEEYDPFLEHPGPAQKVGPFTWPSLILQVDLRKSVPISVPDNLRNFNCQISGHFSPYQCDSLMSRPLADILHIPLRGPEVERKVAFPNKGSPAGVELVPVKCHLVVLESVVLIESPTRDKVEHFSNPQKIEFAVVSHAVYDPRRKLPAGYLCLGWKFIAMHFDTRFGREEDDFGGWRYLLRARDESFCAKGDAVAAISISQ